MRSVRRYILLLLAAWLAAPVSAQQEHERLDSIIKTLDLEEVVVVAKKIRQAGDTLSYAAATYIGRNDRTLEDLLRKMPGIEVKSDGRIVYNGQWINEFYIEGMDLLGADYGVATKNMDAGDIGAVQILEDHQDVKMLRGVRRGAAPAMNIRLKQSAGGIWSSTLHGAMGGQPDLSYDASASLMRFGRNAQHISVYKTNNIGVDLRPEINAPATYTTSYGTGLSYPELPALADRYAYRNASHSLSVNQLLKLGEEKTLTLNLNYLFDRERRNSCDETTYLSDSVARYVVAESNAAEMYQHVVGAHAVYKLNGEKIYLKNTFTANAAFPRGEGAIHELLLQRFSAHAIDVDDALKLNYRRPSGGIAEASFHVACSDRSGGLELPGSGFRQRVDQRSFKVDATGSLLSRSVPRFMFNLNGEADASWQQACTEPDIDTRSTPGGQQTWQVGARVTPKLLWHYGQKFQWLVYVPVGCIYYRSADRGWRYDKIFLSIRPYSHITCKPSDRLSFSLTTVGGESLPSALSLMAEKRFADYRTTVSNPGHVEAAMNRTLQSACNASYTNVLDMLFASVTWTYVRARYGSSSGYEIADETIHYIRSPYATESRTEELGQTFSKGFFRWNSKLSESLTMGVNRSEYYVHDEKHEGRSRYLRAKISYRASFAGWLSFETSNEYALSRSFTDGKAREGAKHAFTNATSIVLWPHRKLHVSPSVVCYHNNYAASYRNNLFLDCSIEYTPGRTILYIGCSNLLDSKVFRRLNDDGIIRYASEYRLRGRTMMAGFRIRIT